MDQVDKLHAMRHSLAHIMASAIGAIWPKAKFGVGPVIENGFYYDVDLGDQTLGPAELEKIETKMREITKADHKFLKNEMNIDEAIELCGKMDQPYKVELLRDLKEHGTTNLKEVGTTELGLDESGKKTHQVSFYQHADFTDLCRGPHVTSTGKVGPFKLTKVSGAYWRGDQKREQLQRVYGVGFETEKELKDYLVTQEEAKKRDHRLLGQQLDLFTFSDLVGPGLPLYTPKGTLVRNLIKSALFEISKKYGNQEVSIPHIAKIDLYEKSGHAQKFSGELFHVKSHYDTEFVMKPVNCPHHIQIYASKPRSYRDLPLAYIESTMQYRDEKPGQIGGLTRTRGFLVDDGHTFLTVDQIKEEVKKITEIIKEFYTSFGMYGNHWVSLSVRDPQEPEGYIGESGDWDKAEKMLEDVAKEQKLDARRMEGEAALYGPKLDFMFKDAFGHDIQLATIQLDFAMPKRFGITYTDTGGSEKTPVIIHRAIAGSYERFMALLLESTAGRLPFWLAPVQVKILTINDDVKKYVGKITKALSETMLSAPVKYNEIRFEVDARNESLGKKIREAEMEKVPVIMIIGPKDEKASEVSIRTQDGEEKIKLNKLTDYLTKL